MSLRGITLVGAVLVAVVGAFAQTPSDLPAAPPSPPDRAPPDLDAGIRQFEHDPNHVYGHELRERPSWWALFERWIQEAIMEPLASQKARFFWTYVAPVLAILGLAWALYRLLGGEGGGPFARRDLRRRGEAGPLLDAEDIAEVDLAALLAGARAAGQLRDVIRYRYLLALQALAARGAVAWRRDKTNRHYASEVRESVPALAGAFDEASRVFAWVWYGDHPLVGPAAPAAERALDRLVQAMAQLANDAPARGRTGQVLPVATPDATPSTRADVGA